MLKAIKDRNPWAVGLVAILLSPGIAMLYINRAKTGVLYLVLHIAVYIATQSFDDTGKGGSSNPQSLEIQLLYAAVLLVYFATVIHCFNAAKYFNPEEPRGWYSGVSLVFAYMSFGIVTVSFFAFFVRIFAYQPFHIPSGSMRPNLNPGDYLFAAKHAYGYSRYSLPFNAPLISGKLMIRHPERGDVVIFKLPSNPGVDYVKRVAGLPGDRVQMINGRFHLNGVAVDLKENGTFRDIESGKDLKQYTETLPNGVSYNILDEAPNAWLDNTPEYTVPEGHYFVLGDNRDNSADSRANREKGFIPEDHIIARVSSIFWNGITKRPDFRNVYLSKGID